MQGRGQIGVGKVRAHRPSSVPWLFILCMYANNLHFLGNRMQINVCFIIPCLKVKFIVKNVFLTDSILSMLYYHMFKNDISDLFFPDVGQPQSRADHRRDVGWRALANRPDCAAIVVRVLGAQEAGDAGLVQPESPGDDGIVRGDGQRAEDAPGRETDMMDYHRERQIIISNQHLR